MSGTIFYRDQRNLLKRDASSGTASMAAPVTSAFNGQLYVTNLTVPHNLGYPPVFRYYYEPFGDGAIWPPLTDRSAGYAYNPQNATQSAPGIIGWVDSTNLYLQLFSPVNTFTGSYPVYYVLYKDFAL